MTIHERVGRHTKLGGKPCQNRMDDQKTVIDLLNRIPVANGGAGGSLSGSTIKAGVASDALYNAIVRFEDKHFPGQRNGFVEPGGAMLKRMEQLAAQTAAAATTLDILRRNVLTEPGFPALTWVAEDRAGIDKHVKAAVRYIDDLKLRGRDKLPAQVLLFGAAWIEDATQPASKIYSHDARGWSTVDRSGKKERPPVIVEMYATPIKLQSFLYTDRTGVVLLFQNGKSTWIGPELVVKIDDLPMKPHAGVVYVYPHQRR
jgi:hypothetical protein